MTLLTWQRKGRRVTMRRPGTWFDIRSCATTCSQPQFGEVYTIAGVSFFGSTTMLAFAEIPAGYVFHAIEFRPVEPLGTGEGMAMLRRMIEDARDPAGTMAVTLSEFEGWQ